MTLDVGRQRLQHMAGQVSSDTPGSADLIFDHGDYFWLIKQLIIR